MSRGRAVNSVFPSDKCKVSSSALTLDPKEIVMTSLIAQLWFNEDGQDIAEYAVMLAVILVIVVGTIRLIGSNANTVFSNVASSIQ